MKSSPLTAIVSFMLTTTALSRGVNAEEASYVVMVDRFSGRPNPTFALEGTDLAGFMQRADDLCKNSEAVDAKYPIWRNDYRGIHVYRKKTSAGNVLSMQVSSGAFSVLVSEPLPYCKIASKRARKMIFRDESRRMEKYLFSVARNKKVLPGWLVAEIEKNFEKGAP